jgi:serine/threonine protein kinase
VINPELVTNPVNKNSEKASFVLGNMDTETSKGHGTISHKRHRLKRRFPIDVRPPSDERALELKKRGSSLWEVGAPWVKYKRCMGTETGKTCLAYEIKAPGNIVAIKPSSNTGISQTREFVRPSHANIVRLLSTFLTQDTVYFVYERMDITLEHLYTGVSLGESDISFICKEVSVCLMKF